MSSSNSVAIKQLPAALNPIKSLLMSMRTQARKPPCRARAPCDDALATLDRILAACPDHWDTDPALALEIWRYMEAVPLKDSGIALIRNYLMQYCSMPRWDENPYLGERGRAALAALRRAAARVASREDITECVAAAISMGILPL